MKKNRALHYRFSSVNLFVLLLDPIVNLLYWQDPSVKELAEQIAKDPSFTTLAQELQQVRQQGSTLQQVDYEKYMGAFQQVMQNPQFITMTKKLGAAVMQVDLGRKTSEK